MLAPCMEWKALIAVVPLLVLAGCAGRTCGTCGPHYAGIEYGSSDSLADDKANTAISQLLQDDFGQALERSDLKAVAAAQAKALRARGTGAAISWSNSSTGHSGEVRPGPVYQVNTTTCREVTHEMVLSIRRYTFRSTACKDPDGRWQTLS